MRQQERLHGRRLAIELTNACNFNCQHCFNRPRPADGYASVDFEAIRRIAIEAYELGCRDYLLTGGEPLTWKPFIPFYEALFQLEGVSVKINTNASLIDDEIASLFRRHPPANLHIGIYGWDESSYAAVTGNPAAYQAAVRGLSLLAERGLSFYLLVPGIRLLAENQAKVDAFVRNRGGKRLVRDWILGDHVYGNEARNAQIKKVRLEPAEVARGLVREPCGLSRIMDELCHPSFRDYRYLFSCLRNYRQVIVDPKLNLLPCIIIRHPDYIFSLKAASLAEGLNFVETLSKVRHQRTDEQERCGKCRIRGICRNCPANAFLEHGDYEGVGDYYCQVSKQVAGLLGLNGVNPP